MNHRVTPPLLFVTSNPGKVREFEAILGQPVEQLDIDLDEIQNLDVAEVVRHKALAAWHAVGRPVIVEDTGIAIPALGGLPGALVKWFVGTIGPAGIAAMVPAGADRTCIATTAVGVADESGVRIITGEVRGIVVPAPRGSDGFGWDPVFQPDGSDRTFAEMSRDEKNRFSMRRRALDTFRAEILGH